MRRHARRWRANKWRIDNQHHVLEKIRDVVHSKTFGKLNERFSHLKRQGGLPMRKQSDDQHAL